MNLLFLPSNLQRAMHIAPHEVAQYRHQPGKEHEVHRRAIVEDVRDAVPEAAHDEERHTEEQRQETPLTRKLHRRTHDEAARDGKQEHRQQALPRNHIHNLLRILDVLGRSIVEDQAHQPAAHEVARDDIQQVGQFPSVGEEARLARIERQSVMHHAEQTEAEHHSSDDTAHHQIHIPTQSDAHTGEHTAYQQIHDSFHIFLSLIDYAKVHFVRKDIE